MGRQLPLDYQQNMVLPALERSASFEKLDVQTLFFCFYFQQAIIQHASNSVDCAAVLLGICGMSAETQQCRQVDVTSSR